MMPLPLTRLVNVLHWLEENANEVVIDTVRNSEPGHVPNPMVLVTKVITRVDFPQVVCDVFSFPKDPDTKEQVNKDLSREFFEIYLDIPTAHMLVKEFVELNQIPDLIKNFQSLPIANKLMEAASIMFGIPYLNSLQQSTSSAQTKSEGSPSHKSTDTSEPVTTEERDLGSTTRPQTDLLQ